MFRNWLEARLLFDGDGGGNGGGGTTLPASAEAAFQRLLDRNNQDGLNLARQLYDENHTYRGQIRDLQNQVTQLQTQVPADGSVVLTAEQAQDWAQYQELGAVADVKQGLEQRAQLEQKVQAAERDTLLRSVAEAAGYKPSVLSHLDRLARGEGKELAFELRDQQVDGQTVKVPFVVDGETAKPLSDYATETWSDFLPALAAQSNTQQTQPGVRYPRQHAGGGGNNNNATSLVDSFVTEQAEKAAAAKNPLIKN